MKRIERIDMLMELLKQEPEDVFLNYALGLEYANELNTVSDAEVQYQKVLRKDENYIPAYYQLGKLYESLTKKTEAIKCFKQGLEKAQKVKDNKAVNEFSEAIFFLED